MATLIGLCLRVKLLRSLPPRFKMTININPGTHASEASVNKQVAFFALSWLTLMLLVGGCFF